MRGQRDDRGQAYTLEGVVGAILVLTALLFATQSVIITPTTGGTVDAVVRTELRQQANDVLVTTAQNESFDLSAMVRYWDGNRQTFVGATNPRVGYGSKEPPKGFGTLLEATFTAHAYQYNIRLRYLGAVNASGPDDGPGTIPLVVRGDPSDNAVQATYAVTLYDNQTLTASDTGMQGVELWELDTNATDGDDGYYPIPDASPGPVYNVVEVRLVVW
jgi:hypothetical protein